MPGLQDPQKTPEGRWRSTDDAAVECVPTHGNQSDGWECQKNESILKNCVFSINREGAYEYTDFRNKKV